MRTPIIIYSAGFLILLAAHIFLNPEFEFSQRVLHSNLDEVEKTKYLLTHPVEANGTQRVDSSFQMGYLDNYTISPGVHLIHDTSLDKEIRISGPRALVDAFVIRDHRDRFFADFDRPVITDSYLEVRVNMTAHGNRKLSISRLLPAKGRSNFPPKFSSEDPIDIDILSFNGFENVDPITVNTRDLWITGHSDPHVFRGTTDICHVRESEDASKSYPIHPGLKFNRVITH